MRNDGTLAAWRTTTWSRCRRGSARRAVPLPQAPLAPELLGLVQHVAAYERLAARAAVTRDPVDARKALLAHPLIGQLELVEACSSALRRGGGAVSVVLAVDGGNSKTDVVLVGDDGEVLGARARARSARRITSGSTAAWTCSSSCSARPAATSAGRAADVGVLLLAGVDFPDEEAACRKRSSARGWVGRTIVGNDTFAVLRAGTERGWGVAVVCGAGINCVGVAPDGRHVRFPALGAISGDWGGGRDVGMAALGPRPRGARTGAGRERASSGSCRRTSASTRRTSSCARYTSAASPSGDVIGSRRSSLPPPTTTPSRRRSSTGSSAEVVAIARAALDPPRPDRRAALTSCSAAACCSRGDVRLLRGIETGLRELGPQLVIDAAMSPPIVGAALLGLDELGAGPEAQARLRRELGEAMENLETREEVG